MNDNLPNLLNISKLTDTLALKLPSFQGPWKYTKTSFGQSNPTFILTGKKNKLVLRKKPSGTLLKSAHMIEREFKVMSALKSSNVPFQICIIFVRIMMILEHLISLWNISMDNLF